MNKLHPALQETKLSYQLEHRDTKPHIGAVLLSTDHSLESEWAKILSQKAYLFVNRLNYSGRLNPTALVTVQKNLKQAAMDVAMGLELDAMLFACTSASIVIGNEAIAKHLNAGRVKQIPTTNPLLATFEALKCMKAQKIAVYSPYPTDVNILLHQRFEESGFQVQALGALHIEHDIYITFITKDSITKGVERLIKDKDIDAVFLSCTNLRVFDFIEELEQKFGVPFITSNQAMYWHTMRLLNQNNPLTGHGQLLSGKFDSTFITS